MKTIELVREKETVTINGRNQELEINTLDLLDTAINAPVKGGYSVSEMSTRLRLIDKVREVRTSPGTPTTITFEDADFKALKQMVADTKWSILSKNILDFCQSFDKQ